VALVREVVRARLSDRLSDALLPTSTFGVGALLALLLPGVIYVGVRNTVAGIRPGDHEVSRRVLQSIMVSATLDAIYLLILGGRLQRLAAISKQGVPQHPRLLGLLVLGLGVATPALVAAALHGRPRWRRCRYVHLGWLPLPYLTRGFEITPTAWDKIVPTQGGKWIRIRTVEGRWVAGWFAGDSFVSTYPECSLSLNVPMSAAFRMPMAGV
jgi:hypothetical protein